MTHTHSFKTLVGLALLAAGSSFAQMTPVGTWHSIDDKTGEAKAEIQIVDKDGALSGPMPRKLATTAKTTAKVKPSSAWKSFAV
jgi:hypothetical protein